MTHPKELQRRPGSDPDIAPGISADISPPPLHPLRPGDREPVTYFELERRKIADPNEPPSDTIPPLPPSSPWASDPVGPEPTIDRTEDGDTINIHGE
jgi:hypothetical protein